MNARRYFGKVVPEQIYVGSLFRNSNVNTALMYSIQAGQLILFKNGPQQLDFYFCSVHSKETVRLIGQIWPKWVNSVLWCYNAAKWWCPSLALPYCLHISQLIAISKDFILTHYISSMHIHSTLAQRHIRFLLCCLTIISEILTSGKITRIVLNKIVKTVFYFLSRIIFYIYIYIYMAYNNYIHLGWYLNSWEAR